MGVGGGVEDGGESMQSGQKRQTKRNKGKHASGEEDMKGEEKQEDKDGRGGEG